MPSDNVKRINKELDSYRVVHNQEWESIQYEERIVAFIDILGFSKTIQDEGIESPKRIFREWDFINKTSLMVDVKAHYEERYGQFAVDSSTISDSVIISCPLSHKNALLVFFGILCNYILSLLINDDIHLSRAGISVGPLYHKGNVVFGPALVQAVDLESKANNPRHIIAYEDMASCKKGWDKDSKYSFEDFRNFYFRKADDYYYIDIFARLFGYYYNRKSTRVYPVIRENDHFSQIMMQARKTKA